MTAAASKVARWGMALAGVAIALPAAGCNFVLGLEDHGAFPDNCGADTLTTARFSFSDDATGHCYSLVQSDDPDMGTSFLDAKSSCAEAGAIVACVNDQPELQLIAKSVPTRAWLGMTAQTNTTLDFSCISGEPFAPNYPAWAPDHPRSDNGGGNCTALNNGLVESSSCGVGLQNWLCEFAPQTPGN